MTMQILIYSKWCLTCPGCRFGHHGKVQLERESLWSIEVVKRASLLIFTDGERNPLTEGKIERWTFLWLTKDPNTLERPPGSDLFWPPLASYWSFFMSTLDFSYSCPVKFTQSSESIGTLNQDKINTLLSSYWDIWIIILNDDLLPINC